MAAKQGKIRNWLEYAAAMAGYAYFAYAPLPLAAWSARLMADVWRSLDGRHRRRIEENAGQCLGLDAAAATELAKENYRHFGLLLVECCRLGRATDRDFERHVDNNGVEEYAAELMKAGKGLVFITGHLGNWEWSGAALGRMGFVDGCIARAFDNPLLDRFINKIRERHGNRIWEKRGAIRKALTALKDARGFGAVMDQDGGRMGRMAPFFGRPASTMRFPVEIAIKTGAPLLVGALLRNGKRPLDFRISYREALWPEPGADPASELSRLLAAINRNLESVIRERPEQWIWIHKRWKTTETSDMTKPAKAPAEG